MFKKIAHFQILSMNSATEYDAANCALDECKSQLLNWWKPARVNLQGCLVPKIGAIIFTISLDLAYI